MPRDIRRGTVLCAPDSFKGTLSADEAAEAMGEGVREAWPEASVKLLPLADGGEGSLEVLHKAAGGSLRPVEVRGPLGDPVRASYLRLPGARAVVEMAQASGLLLTPRERRDAGAASTHGTGELIRAAVEEGARSVIVCLGGSATTDGGAGMAEALGFRILDTGGRPLPPGGVALADAVRIDDSNVIGRIRSVTFTAATDVTNPLCGPRGAAVVYAPQKGADIETVRLLEKGLRRFSALLGEYHGSDVANLPGAGAAGGLGAGLVGFLNARIESGAEVLMDAAGIADLLPAVSLCLTGEGRIDLQSGQGKLIGRLARRCTSAGVPLVAIGGSVSDDADDLTSLGVSVIVSVSRECGEIPPDHETAARALRRSAAAVCRLVGIGAISAGGVGGGS